ncbi:MAG: hypothetical protein AAGA48_37225 [Myxococcota bacterium]
MTIADEPALTSTHIRVDLHRGTDYPAELAALRKRVDGDKFSARPGGRFDANDDAGEHALVYRDGALVVAVASLATEASDFITHSGHAAEHVSHTFLLTGIAVDPSDKSQGYLALAIYTAMRQQRMAGRTHYVAMVENGEPRLSQMLRTSPIRSVPGREVQGTDGQTRTLVAVEGRIDEAMLRCFEAMNEEQRDTLRDGFIAEIRAAVMAGVDKFVVNPFFLAARAGTLSQEQYTYAMGNQHHLVRFTTRILGLAVGACEDPSLRKHYAHHLSGEVNHEVWIEDDLAYLDADVDYVKNVMVPEAAILKFCFIQESLTSFRRDPVVFMGVPIAIEGAAAFTPMESIEGIRECIRSWGYDSPKLGTRFLASHVHADGGHEDHEGHWDGTLRMMKDYVRTESQHQQILRVIRLVFESLNTAYAGYVAQPSL